MQRNAYRLAPLSPCNYPVFRPRSGQGRDRMTKDWDIGHPAQHTLCCKDTHSRATCPQNFLAIPRCSLSLYDGTMGDWPSLADQPFNNFIFLGRSSWHYFPGNVKAKKRPAVEEDGCTCDVTPRYAPVLTPRSQK